MKAKAKPSQAAKDGQAAGTWLIERAPHMLLTEYGQRPNGAHATESTRRLTAITGELQKALGPMANDPAVADAMHKLDGAIWDVAVEHEDRAWHAAWSLAMALQGGR
jgi:hypothetical protein